jgi:hypothetical protein
MTFAAVRGVADARLQMLELGLPGGKRASTGWLDAANTPCSGKSQADS